MLSLLRHSARPVVASILAMAFLLSASFASETHVVSPAELHKQTTAASQVRQQNIEAVRTFLSTPAAEKALKSAHMDAVRVNKAVSNLSDQELAQLAARANKAQADFAAGNFSDRDLILVILAIAALILIIVAVR